MRRGVIGVVGLILVGLLPAPARAQGRVELELVTEERVSITAQQEWMRRLAQAGITDVRLRVSQPADVPSMENRGTASSPIYAVKGVIVSDTALLMPGRKFGLGDLKQLSKWLDDLAQQGPEERRPQKTAFGLELEQFQQVHKDLSQPVGFSTDGLGRREVVEKIAGQLQFSLERNVPKLQAADEKVTEELSAFSRGTALAYLLRPLGLCLVPQASAGHVEYAVVDATAEVKSWPVGQKPERPEPEVAPVMFEFLNVNVQGVAITEVLKAVSKRGELPVLWDYRALARHGIEPEKMIVNHPRSRTTYSLMLRKTLFQAKLKSEVRTDDAGKPFLWVTTVKPM
jgi:hypothetical protein